MARDLYCNKCGTKLDSLELQQGFSMVRRIGFGSKYDGDVLSLRLCCNCMDELIDSCMVSPIVPGENE